MSDTSIIEFDDVRFTYDGAANALDGLSLRIGPGEFVCVLGGNGSGKSTLAKHVNALLVPDAGAVRVLGRDTRDVDATYFIRGNAGMVFQNPDDQIVASIIEDDIAFGPENLGVPLPELRDRVTRSLAQVGLQGFEKHETAALSGGQKQRVAIAGVLAMNPQILVLDEPSAMLDPRGRAGLIRVCRKLNDQGLTIVYITHFMEEAAAASRVVALDAGRIALDGTPHDVLTEVGRLSDLHLDIPFAAQMSAALRERGLPAGMHASIADLEEELLAGPYAFPQGEGTGKAGVNPCDPHPGKAKEGEGGSRAAPLGTKALGPEPAGCEPSAAAPAITLEGVSFTYEPASRKARRRATPGASSAKWGNDPDERWALRDISLNMESGEFLGIAGHTGSGKSTLIQLASGLLQPTEGRVFASGADLADKRAARDARGEIGVVFQYPERQLFAATVFDDVAFGPRNLGLDASEVEARVQAALELVRLDLADLRDKSPFALSGGQQRRVAIAGVLAMQPTTLILDEPTAGLDPRARASLLSLIAELHDSAGFTIALVSHNMDDLARLSDRIAILNQGRLVAIGSPAEVFADEEALHGIGLAIPSTLHLAGKLGLDAKGTVPSVAQLADLIVKQALR